MCTAISLYDKDHYFGRNLDFHYDFGETITITPRNYRFLFKNGTGISCHYAIIGTALVSCDYPLYFDAVNEKGLGMAGLYFPQNAIYNKISFDKINVASFELIPWILSQCKTVDDAKKLLSDINITDEAFSEDMKPSPLHWFIADKEKSITLEQTSMGVNVYENSVGVLTNNPTFDVQMLNLVNYMQLSTEEPQNNFYKNLCLAPYSRGMGAIGLPGDNSSMSRFVRACFMKLNSVSGDAEEERVHQFFHILYSVYQQRGVVRIDDAFEITHYTSCINATKGIYYYTTYNNNTINAVDMHKENLNSDRIISYEMKKDSSISL